MLLSQRRILQVPGPILTHRHLGSAYPIACIGHADTVLLQNSDYRFRVERMLVAGRQVLRLTKRRGGVEEVLAEAPVEAIRVCLQVEARGQEYSFSYASSNGKPGDSVADFEWFEYREGAEI